ncbi:MAG: hypothetical protein WKF37_20040 [Bryobacteraceae bacterium]
MKKLTWILLAPMVLFSDTLILQDGTRHTGTFVSGTSRTLTFALENGSRRSFPMQDVDELSFRRSNDAVTTAGSSSAISTQRIDALQRLHDDIQMAMDNVTLSPANSGCSKIPGESRRCHS